MCKSAAAAAQCPLACLSVQECFIKQETVPSFQVWDRVRRLEPMDNSPNGTLCLGSSMVAGTSSTSSLSRAKVVQQCEAWQQRGGLASEVPRVVENWLESMTVGREGRRLNVTEPCTLVAAAIDEHCSFDIAQVEEFTRLVKKNGGDMTLAFWVKPIHELSLIGSRFFPQITFFSRLHPPQHVINQGEVPLSRRAAELLILIHPPRGHARARERIHAPRGRGACMCHSQVICLNHRHPAPPHHLLLVTPTQYSRDCLTLQLAMSKALQT